MTGRCHCRDRSTALDSAGSELRGRGSSSRGNFEPPHTEIAGHVLLHESDVEGHARRHRRDAAKTAYREEDGCVHRDRAHRRTGIENSARRQGVEAVREKRRRRERCDRQQGKPDPERHLQSIRSQRDLLTLWTSGPRRVKNGSKGKRELTTRSGTTVRTAAAAPAANSVVEVDRYSIPANDRPYARSSFTQRGGLTANLQTPKIGL